MATMLYNQRIIVSVTPDEKQYTWWIENAAGGGRNPSNNSMGNATTVAATLAAAVQAALPTLSS